MNTIVQLLSDQLLEKEEYHLFLTTFNIYDNKSRKPWKEWFNYLMKEDSKWWKADTFSCLSLFPFSYKKLVMKKCSTKLVLIIE